MKLVFSTLLATATVVLAGLATISEPALSDIAKAQATTLPEVTNSNVQGLVFNRFFQVWLENIDYEDSAADKSQEWLASQGILLTNFFAVAHPSQPNYCASAGGDTFGMDHDNFCQVPANVSTIADLLDTKSVSWAEYQEHMPYPGFQGFNYSNQQTYLPDYVRKHNPLVLYDSVASNDTRIRQIKNFTDFDNDLKNKKLPQYAFVTPNMTNDAHDTNITFGGSWERKWMEPLLKNDYFMEKTVILLTFDEDKAVNNFYPKNNRIFSVLVGGAIPDHLKGTKDDTFYTHYSTIASLSANWGLPSLGRWDCGANIFELVANKTGYVNYDVTIDRLHLNNTYPGPLSANVYSKFSADWPNPTTEGNCSAGHGILDHVKKTYNGTKPSHNYTFPFPWDEKTSYNVNVTATRMLNGKTVNLTSSNDSTSGSGSKKNGVAGTVVFSGSITLAGALMAAFACFM
ncbi:Acid phosphatase [Penicillium longicatenatum]|uniref:Acid phosphatase n=1 Tax=Penicillium longicatenatum TaxID=1561947 RepID=UPI002548B416|nr:Acid phosphatase [Penicillium longicatenatum]KAJ5636593.1 Acid phosphatase [Penicillium longicatenatum]